MRWAWKIGRIAGVQVFVHATFLMLLGWIALSGYMRTGRLETAMAGVGFTLAVFGVVVLHELGHALTARRFGIKTRDITLWPIGGVARLERMPEKPRQELLVALAGPAVNVVLASVILGISLAAGRDVTSLATLSEGAPFWTRLFWVNVVLALFNLLPAFPMDGGRALRALLAMKMDFLKATQTAAAIGQALALGMAITGLFFNPFLMFVALFVWIGAAAETAAAAATSALQGLPVSVAMLTRFGTLGPYDTLGTAATQLLAGSDTDFPVVSDGSVVGLLTRNDLVRGLAERGADARVHGVMRTNVTTAEPAEMLDRVMARIEGSTCKVVPVVHGGKLVGLVTPENVAELVMLRTVSWRRRPGPPEGSTASSPSPTSPLVPQTQP
jgi:Zn-dependent protease/CBS domain-containing protein